VTKGRRSKKSKKDAARREEAKKLSDATVEVMKRKK
jgi:hypothetical protein